MTSRMASPRQKPHQHTHDILTLCPRHNKFTLLFHCSRITDNSAMGTQRGGHEYHPTHTQTIP